MNPPCLARGIFFAPILTNLLAQIGVMRTLIIFLLACTTATAQITVTDADMPSAGDIKVVSIGNPMDISNPELTGTNYTWDFSLLTAVQQRQDTFVTVSSTPLGYQVFFNNIILYPDHVADFGLKVESPISLPQLSVEDVIDYHANSSSHFKRVGFGARINSVPTSVRFTPTDTQYVFPMNYGDTWQGNYFYDITIPALLYFGESATRTDTVDGWGTVMTPFGTFDALRVKSILHKTDSTYIDLVGFGTTQNLPEEIEYKWLANGQDIPVMKIVTRGGIVTTVEYLDNFLGIGIDEKDHADIQIRPNPANDLVFVETQGSHTSGVRVYSLDGQLVKSLTSTVKTIRLDVSDLANGTYVIEVSDGDRMVSEQLVISR